MYRGLDTSESYMSDRRDLCIEDWILVNLTCRIGGIYV